MKPLRYGLVLLVALPAFSASAQVHQDWLQVVEGTSIITGVPGATTADIAVDAAGSAFVATAAEEAGGIYTQGLLVKYGADGGLLWSKTHDGVAMGYDAFAAVALDDAGGVYVAGWEEYEDPSGVRYLQIVVQRYDGASGDLLWSRTYDAFEQGDADFRGTDQAVAIAADGMGGVYVYGTSAQRGTQFHSDDLILLKYSAAGDLQWYRTFDETAGTGVSREQSVAMRLDDAGHVYLAAVTDPGFNANYLTLKYDGDGSLQWHQVLDNVVGGEDRPAAITVDEQQNVVVTGTTAHDCAGTCRDYLTVAYTPGGGPLWVMEYDNGNSAPRNDDWATDVATDAAGNVYVTGYSHQADQSFYDYLTVTYDPLGTERWTRRYDGSVNQHDRPYAIALDEMGNAYVTGTTTVGNHSEYGTIKYSTAGALLWSVMKDPPTNGSNDYPTALAVVAEDEVYVTGYQELTDSANLITVRYRPGITSVEPTAGLPAQPALDGAHPNPFAEAATIRFRLPEPAHVRLAVYDLLGREVAVLADGSRPAGEQAVTLDGRGLPSGAYVVRLDAGGVTAARRVTLVR